MTTGVCEPKRSRHASSGDQLFPYIQHFFFKKRFYQSSLLIPLAHSRRYRSTAWVGVPVGLDDARRSCGLPIGPPKFVAKDKHLSVIVNIVGVVNGVVLAPHDGPYVPVHCVMDVCGPNGGEEQKSKVGQVMARDQKEDHHVRAGL